MAAAAFDEAIAVTRPADSRWGRCINMIEWVGAERRCGAFDAAAAGLLELLQLLTANGHRSLLSQALREVAYVLHAGGDDETAVVALVAREGLPDMPVLGGTRDEPLEAVLRDAAGDDWDRLRLRARSLPEADLVRLCRERLEGSRSVLGHVLTGGAEVRVDPWPVSGAEVAEIEVREHEPWMTRLQERNDGVPAHISRGKPEQHGPDAIRRRIGRVRVTTPDARGQPTPSEVDQATSGETQPGPDDRRRERAHHVEWQPAMPLWHRVDQVIEQCSREDPPRVQRMRGKLG